MTPPVIAERIKSLDDLTLYAGAHEAASKKFCAMEAVAWLNGEPHSASPKCASPVITTFMIGWNDRLRTNEQRDRLLRPLLEGIIGTRSTAEVEQKRREMLRSWANNVALPKYLEAAKMHDHAQEVFVARSMTRCTPLFVRSTTRWCVMTRGSRLCRSCRLVRSSWCGICVL